VGAATANLWGAVCRASGRGCNRSSCLYPDICPHLDADQGRWLDLLKKIAALPGLKQVRVASGLRFDLALTDEKALAEFLGRFVGGQLKVAPEHLDPALLKLMRKPGPEVFEKFLKFFQKHAPAGQYLVPYLISAFPGSDEAAMDRLAGWFRRRFWRPRQVQAFIPTPGTVAAAMYYAGMDERGRPLKVARNDRDRRAQHRKLTAGLQKS
jgi:uncharacterized radical SAM protein YgiQ